MTIFIKNAIFGCMSKTEVDDRSLGTKEMRIIEILSKKWRSQTMVWQIIILRKCIVCWICLAGLIFTYGNYNIISRLRHICFFMNGNKKYFIYSLIACIRKNVFIILGLSLMFLKNFKYTVIIQTFCYCSWVFDKFLCFDYVLISHR